MPTTNIFPGDVSIPGEINAGAKPRSYHSLARKPNRVPIIFLRRVFYVTKVIPRGDTRPACFWNDSRELGGGASPDNIALVA